MVIGGSLRPAEVQNQSVSSSAASAGGQTAHKHWTLLCTLSLRHWPVLWNVPLIKTLFADNGVTGEGWHQCNSGLNKKNVKKEKGKKAAAAFLRFYWWQTEGWTCQQEQVQEATMTQWEGQARPHLDTKL